MKSTPEMRARIRELMTNPQDDYDRAVECVLDDLDVMIASHAHISERAAHGWQPIETATKDGSRTLIAWLTIKNEWRFSFAKWDPSIEYYCLEDRDAMVGARYWMPLPAPDAVSGAKEP